MIKILAFGLILLAAVAGADEAFLLMSDPALTIQNGVLHFSGKEFSGEVRSYYPDGMLKSSARYADGLRQGLNQFWYLNSQIMREIGFEAGQRQGEALGWWPNGQLQSRRYYVDGQLHGQALEWNESGQEKFLQNFQLGHENGLQRGWHEDGELAFSYVFRDGRRYGLLGSSPCYSTSIEATEYFNEGL